MIFPCSSFHELEHINLLDTVVIDNTAPLMAPSHTTSGSEPRELILACAERILCFESEISANRDRTTIG